MKFFRKWLFGPVLKSVEYKRDQHKFSTHYIEKNALSVLKSLDGCGYDAYLVGGVIRDSLLGIKSKDCDVVTNVKPEKIIKRIKGSIIIGRRFRIVHARFGRQIVEISTFRSNATSRSRKISSKGIIKRDNVYGCIEEDVMRRDFTINGLYYRYKDQSILDFVGGMEDLKARRLRSIGDPLDRFPEDPVRMLRVVRFAAKLELSIDQNILEAIQKHKVLLREISGQRLFAEMVKIYYSGHAKRANDLMQDLGIATVLMPSILELRRTKEAKLLWNTMAVNADKRYKDKKRLSVTYLFACLYWPMMAEKMAKSKQSRFSLKVANEVLNGSSIDISLRIKEDILEIWKNQYAFKLKEKAPSGLLRSKRLRASYELLCQRAMIEPRLADIAMYWESSV